MDQFAIYVVRIFQTIPAIAFIARVVIPDNFYKPVHGDRFFILLRLIPKFDKLLLLAFLCK